MFQRKWCMPKYLTAKGLRIYFSLKICFTDNFLSNPFSIPARLSWSQISLGDLQVWWSIRNSLLSSTEQPEQSWQGQEANNSCPSAKYRTQVHGAQKLFQNSQQSTEEKSRKKLHIAQVPHKVLGCPKHFPTLKLSQAHHLRQILWVPQLPFKRICNSLFLEF